VLGWYKPHSQALIHIPNAKISRVLIKNTALDNPTIYALLCSASETDDGREARMTNVLSHNVSEEGFPRRSAEFRAGLPKTED